MLTVLPDKKGLKRKEIIETVIQTDKWKRATDTGRSPSAESWSFNCQQSHQYTSNLLLRSTAELSVPCWF